MRVPVGPDKYPSLSGQVYITHGSPMLQRFCWKGAAHGRFTQTSSISGWLWTPAVQATRAPCYHSRLDSISKSKSSEAYLHLTYADMMRQIEPP
jgi:hypothetical protein